MNSGVNCFTHSTAQACGTACRTSASCKAFTFVEYHIPCSCMLYVTSLLTEPQDDGNATAFSYIKSRYLYSPNIYKEAGKLSVHYATTFLTLLPYSCSVHQRVE